MKLFSYKGGCGGVGVVDVEVHVSRHLKEELAWTLGEQLQVIHI